MFARFRQASIVTIATLATAATLGACSGDSGDDSKSSGEKVTVATAKGQVEVPKNPKRVVALDNTSVETIKALGITPVAVPKGLLAKDVFKDWIDDPNIKDVGSHGEPKLDVVEDVNPDLVIGGYRFSKYYDDLKKITDKTGGVTIDIAANEEAEGGYTASLVTQTKTLGTIFGKEGDAQKIVDDFNANLDAAKKAATGQTVFLSIVNGGKIDNGAKRMSPLTGVLNLKDVFAGEAGDHHQNSGLTPEAIAQANPQWVIVMDRDAAVEAEGGGKPKTAEEVFKAQDAFRGLEFMTKNQIVYLDPYFYLREGIQCYGENYKKIADAINSKK